jgi:modulator of FtsH protease
MSAAGFAIDEWHDFFLANVGAAAALLGLLFVALSINLERILSFAWLPGRAGETIVVFFEALVVSALCLVPQSARALGWEVLAAGVVGWLIPVTLQLQGKGQAKAQAVPFGRRVILTQIATLPVIVAGVSLIAEGGGGLYWLVPGIVFLLAVGLTSAWVLLVEILR